MTKDYYQVLGVLADAEDIVIRAAYKALAQRYHPDKWVGDKAESNRRMAEINEAYGVLSDPIKRKQYDAQRERTNYQASDQADDGLSESIQAEWDQVIAYYPDLVEIERNLCQISNSLAQSYKLLMLENRDFSHRKEIANQREKIYLINYFGTNEEILLFAKSLIISGKRDAARELNEAICLLGDKIDPNVVINRIRRMYGLEPVSPKIKIPVINRYRLFFVGASLFAAYFLITMIASILNDSESSSSAKKPSLTAKSASPSEIGTDNQTLAPSAKRSDASESKSPTIESANRNYALLVRSCIQKGVAFPIPPRQSSSNPSAQFIVRFSADSSIAGITLKRSSGNAGFDRAVEAGIRRCIPFPMPTTSSILTDIEVTYSMYE